MLWLLASSSFYRICRSAHDYSVGGLFHCNNATRALDVCRIISFRISLCSYLKRNEISPITKTIPLTSIIKLTQHGFFIQDFFQNVPQAVTWIRECSSVILLYHSQEWQPHKHICLCKASRNLQTFFSRISFGCSVFHFSL